MSNTDISRWQNTSPRTMNFTTDPGGAISNYGKIPNFQQTTGTLPGTTPIVPPHTVASAPRRAFKSVLAIFPSIFPKAK